MTEHHRPLPWRRHPKSAVCVIDPRGLTVIELCNWRELPFIVRACNCHEELVNVVAAFLGVYMLKSDIEWTDYQTVAELARAALAAAGRKEE